jgi:phosphate transport system permease protein
VKSQPPFLSFDWLWSPFSVLPIQMFNWVSRPDQAFVVNAAAAGLVLIFVTLSLNAVAIVIRYRVRKRIKW